MVHLTFINDIIIKCALSDLFNTASSFAAQISAHSCLDSDSFSLTSKRAAQLVKWDTRQAATLHCQHSTGGVQQSSAWCSWQDELV